MNLYDPKCAALAKGFLRDERMDTPENINDLALEIQQLIEDFIANTDKRTIEPLPERTLAEAAEDHASREPRSNHDISEDQR